MSVFVRMDALNSTLLNHVHVEDRLILTVILFSLLSFCFLAP